MRSRAIFHEDRGRNRCRGEIGVASSFPGAKSGAKSVSLHLFRAGSQDQRAKSVSLHLFRAGSQDQDRSDHPSRWRSSMSSRSRAASSERQDPKVGIGPALFDRPWPVTGRFGSVPAAARRAARPRSLAEPHARCRRPQPDSASGELSLRLSSGPCAEILPRRAAAGRPGPSHLSRPSAAPFHRSERPGPLVPIVSSSAPARRPVL